MADVAVISVISSGVVGVLGAASGFYAQRITLHNEDSKRLEARRDDLRDVLAEAATVVMGYNPPVGRYEVQRTIAELELTYLAAPPELIPP